MSNTKIKKLHVVSNQSKRAFSFKSFFRAYLNAMHSKALFFVYPSWNSSVANLLKCLEKDSRIAGYHILEEDSAVKVFLNYDLTKNVPLVQKTNFYSSQGRKRVVTVEILQKFHTLNPNSLAIISTHKGLMSVADCLLHRCGGEFLVSLI